MTEEDLQTIMKAPFVMVGSDGRALCPDGILSSGPPHPRSFGTFPRVISRYALYKRAITIEDAIRKMTSMPAGRLNIKDRGYVKPGFKADIVVFDPGVIADRATFDSPRLYPSGIEYVVVNGMPDMAPVCLPSATTIFPFTTTYSIPDVYKRQPDFLASSILLSATSALPQFGRKAVFKCEIWRDTPDL